MHSDLLLPGHAADAIDPSHDVGIARAFDAHLQELDERLRCFWVKPDAEGFDPSGRWYVGLMHPNVELRQFWAVTNPDGSYCEPGQRHLDMLMRMDTQSGQQSWQKIQEARTTSQLAREKRREETRREFREKLTDRLDHAYNPRVAIPKAIPVPQPGLTTPARELVVVERPR